MKDRNLEHSNDWATPEYIYDPLNEEFKFDFDPCPLNSSFDGLSLSLVIGVVLILLIHPIQENLKRDLS